MGFISAKCPACSKGIEIPGEEKEFFCPYCGSKFLRDAAYAFAAMPGMTADDVDLSEFVITGTTLVSYRGTRAHVVIPSHITLIDTGAFEGNKAISTVVIPDGVTAIEEGAFRGCTSLAEVSMSKSIVSIGKEAFKRCRSLREIEFPRSLETLGEWSFSECSSLVSALIPSSCTYIMDDDYGDTFASSPTRITEY